MSDAANDQSAFMSELRRDLKLWRKEMGFTQLHVGEKLGLRQSAISSFESAKTGLRGTPLSLAVAIVEEFRIRSDRGSVSEQRKLYRDPLETALGQIEGLVEFMNSPLYGRDEKIRKFETAIKEISDGAPALAKAARGFSNGQDRESRAV